MRARCDRGAWTWLQRGVYRIRDTAADDEQRRAIRAAALSAGDDVAVVGRSAGIWHRIAGMPPYDGVVHLGVSRNRPRKCRRGVFFHQLDLADEDIVELDGVRVSSAIRSVTDLLLGIGRVYGLCVLDSALNLHKISASNLAEIEAALVGRPGARKARPLLGLADGRSQSPLETRVRLACIDGGVPPDELQWAVYDAFGVLWATETWRGFASDGARSSSRLTAPTRIRSPMHSFAIGDGRTGWSLQAVT